MVDKVEREMFSDISNRAFDLRMTKDSHITHKNSAGKIHTHVHFQYTEIQHASTSTTIVGNAICDHLRMFDNLTPQLLR